MTATKFRMDFSNVKESGNFSPRRKPEGDYLAKVVKVEDHTSKEGQAGFVLTVMLDGDKRSTYPVYCNRDEKGAWKVRKLFIAAGIPVPKKVVMVDPNKLLNKAIGVSLEDDEFNGRVKSTIADFLPVDDIQPNDDEDGDYEDEEPAKTTKRRPAPAEPEDEEEYEDDDEEEEEPPAPPARKRAPAKKATTTRRAPEPEEDDEDEEEEDEEPEEKPAPRRRTAAKKTTTTRRRRPAQDEDDDLEDIEDL